MMNQRILCKRKNCDFNSSNGSCCYEGDCLTITSDGCDNFRLKNYNAKLKKDVTNFCAEVLYNFHEMMPKSFVDNICNKVKRDADYKNGNWGREDIQLAFEGVIGAKFGLPL